MTGIGYKQYYEKDSKRRSAGRGLSPQNHILLRELECSNNQSVLDIGCGGGGLLKEFSAGDIGTLFGVDVSINQLRTAKHQNLNLTLGDAPSLPFTDHSFDIVIANEVLEHVIKPSKLIDEIHRVLKHGGRAILTLPIDRNFFVGRLWTLDMKAAFYDYRHLHDFSSLEKIEVILDKKFKVSNIIKENDHHFVLFSKIVSGLVRVGVVNYSFVNHEVPVSDQTTKLPFIKRLWNAYASIFTIRPHVHIIYFLKPL